MHNTILLFQGLCNHSVIFSYICVDCNVNEKLPTHCTSQHISNVNFSHEKHYEMYIKCNNLLHVNNRPSYPTLQNYVMNVYSLNDKYLDKVLFVHMNVLFISCYIAMRLRNFVTWLCALIALERTWPDKFYFVLKESFSTY